MCSVIIACNCNANIGMSQEGANYFSFLCFFKEMMFSSTISKSCLYKGTLQTFHTSY